MCSGNGKDSAPILDETKPEESSSRNIDWYLMNPNEVDKSSQSSSNITRTDQMDI